MAELGRQQGWWREVARCGRYCESRTYGISWWVSYQVQKQRLKMTEVFALRISLSKKTSFSVLLTKKQRPQWEAGFNLAHNGRYELPNGWGIVIRHPSQPSTPPQRKTFSFCPPTHPPTDPEQEPRRLKSVMQICIQYFFSFFLWWHLSWSSSFKLPGELRVLILWE